MSRNNNRRGSGAVVAILTILIVIMIFVTAYVIKLCLDLTTRQPDPNRNETNLSTQPQETESTVTEPEPTETKPEPVHVVSTATIASTGDLLMHLPVINAHLESDGTYDFTRAFQYLSQYASSADYAVANLETTLAGTDNGYAYHGYPCFNCPDEIVDGAKDAGFDMLLTSNNHCYDTRHVGLTRTLRVIEEKGLASLGTMNSAEDPKYLVVDINDIQVGMLCYTYSSTQDSGLPNINGIPVNAQSKGMINTFDYSRLDAFYTEVASHLESMASEGAEAYMMYIHWGFEYENTPHQYQTAIAQKLCDLGIDVIVGGHPHVVQPMDLLESTVDPEHKTVCIYSVGNALSNQNRNTIGSCPNGHCEDGMLFSVTFEKYSDGTVYLSDTDVLPTWVNWLDGSPNKYNILPLDDETRSDWTTLYNLNANSFATAEGSYSRTMGLVSDGLEEAQSYLEDAKTLRDWEYLAAVDPEAAGPMPTEETVPQETTADAA